MCGAAAERDLDGELRRAGRLAGVEGDAFGALAGGDGAVGDRPDVRGAGLRRDAGGEAGRVFESADDGAVMVGVGRGGGDGVRVGRGAAGGVGDGDV